MMHGLLFVTGLFSSYMLGLYTRYIFVNELKRSNQSIKPTVKHECSSLHVPLEKKINDCTPSKFSYERFSTNKNNNASEDMSPSNLIYSVENGDRLVRKSYSIEGKVYRTENPSAKHIVLDIKSLDKFILSHEPSLVKALSEFAKISNIHLLYYRCFSREHNGKTCHFVYSASQIMLYTWPESGIMMLDIHAQESSHTSRIISRLLQSFGASQWSNIDTNDTPEYLWSEKIRGSRRSTQGAGVAPKQNSLHNKTGYVIKEVPSLHTIKGKSHLQDDNKFTQMDQRVLLAKNHSESSASRTGQKIQTNFSTSERGLRDEIHSESLVHPGMFAHENPKKIAIIGRNEGGTLREVLKHKSVETVKIIGLDEFSCDKMEAKSIANCSDIKDSTMSCFDDNRVELYFGSPDKWLIDPFLNTRNCKSGNNCDEMFDVIIMNNLDDLFVSAVSHAIADEGIVIVNLGRSPGLNFRSKESIFFKHYLQVENILKKEMRMRMLHIYEESHGGILGPRSYVVACKSKTCNSKWLSNNPLLEIQIHHRIFRTYSGAPPLKYVDGATLASYQVPHKVIENLYCQRDPIPNECTILQNHGNMPNLPLAQFQVENSIIIGGGKGVFAKVDMMKGALIGRESAVHVIHFSPETYHVVSKYHRFLSGAHNFGAVYFFMEGYGFEGEDMGGWDMNLQEYFVDGSINLFVNHGCDYSNNIGSRNEYYCMNSPNCSFMSESMTEEIIETLDVPELISPNTPIFRRHRLLFLTGFDVTLRDIKLGEEILMNYLYFEQNNEDRSLVANQMRKICAGTSIGQITKYKDSKQ